MLFLIMLSVYLDAHHEQKGKRKKEKKRKEVSGSQTAFRTHSNHNNNKEYYYGMREISNQFQSELNCVREISKRGDFNACIHMKHLTAIHICAWLVAFQMPIKPPVAGYNVRLSTTSKTLLPKIVKELRKIQINK
uniref:Uncharacterized protein n=1 Tax=Glossina palpalis gambiensis TaxID=67801 RepID=A0A1B0B760_9MUSC